MHITGITAYRYMLRPKFGSYALSGGRDRSVDPCLVVCVATDGGVVGWGECAMLGRTHVAAFPESETAAGEILAAALMGLDPRAPLAVQDAMNTALLAGRSAKSALDIACWDIAAQAADLPLAEHLGGRRQDRLQCWESIPMLPPDAIAAHVAANVPASTCVAQIKVGGDPRLDVARVEAALACLPPGCHIVADANGGWGVQDAIAAIRNLPGRWTAVEQPCATLADCAAVFTATGRPMILDESMASMADLFDMKSRCAAGGVSIKPGKLGGLTQARLMRDAAVQLGLTITIDDLWGGSITTAALAHLAAGVPQDRLLAVTPFADLVLPAIADGPRRDAQGMLPVPKGPGLGIRIDLAALGPPILVVGQPTLSVVSG